MQTTQNLFNFATLLFFIMAAVATGYSAKRLLTQDPATPLPQGYERTLWTVPCALWAIFFGIRWILC